MARRPRQLGTPQSPSDYFGAELRAYREAEGLSRPQLGERLGYSGQWIGQIELRNYPPSEEFARDCDTYFKTNGTFYRLWKWIKELNKLQVLSPGFRPFVEAERVASYIKIFGLVLIPGLFQTEDYARAVMKFGQRKDVFDELCEIRMQRQAILDREDPPWVLALLSEIALRRFVGSPEIMREQLQRLLVLNEEPHITIRVIPADAPAYQPSGFMILSFEDQPDVAYIDGAGGYGPLLENSRDVDGRTVVFDQLGSVALPVEDSERLIRSIMESM